MPASIPWRSCLGTRCRGHRLTLACFHVACSPPLWNQSGSGQLRSESLKISACLPHDFGTTTCGSYWRHAESPSNDMMPVGVDRRPFNGVVCVQPPSVPPEDAAGLCANAPFDAVSAIASAMRGGGCGALAPQLFRKLHRFAMDVFETNSPRGVVPGCLSETRNFTIRIR